MRFASALMLALIVGLSAQADIVYERVCENGVCRLKTVEVPPQKMVATASPSIQTFEQPPVSVHWVEAQQRKRPLLAFVTNRPIRRFILRLFGR